MSIQNATCRGFFEGALLQKNSLDYTRTEFLNFYRFFEEEVGISLPVIDGEGRSS